MQDQDLFQKIIDFDFDTTNYHLNFTRRLAERHAWAWEYACELVQEYRRFMYLAAISDQEISPSKPIDEAWHLHLEDHDNYARFCHDAIGKYIEHRPASEASEAERMRAQYARTLELYLKEFGEVPYCYYWPTVRHNRRPDKRYKTGKELGYFGSLVTVGGLLVLGASSTIAFTVVFAGVAMTSSGLMIAYLYRPDALKSGGALCGGGSGSSDGGAACGGGGCGGGGCGGGG